MKMKVAVIIPNLNGAAVIGECLESLQAQSYPRDIFVVDNGSADNSVALIESAFPDVNVIKLPRNEGFSGGVNAGFKAALSRDYDAVVAFNNDAVADSKWLENLVNTMQSDSRIGIVGPKQLLMDESHIDAAGLEYSIWGMPFPRGRNQRDQGQFDKTEPTFAATRGATLYRVEMLKDTGLFDDEFFAYLEDVDLSFRARLAGWEIMYEPAAVIYHHVGNTSSALGSFTRYHATKNFYLLYAKNLPGLLYWKYLPLFLVEALMLATSSLLKGGFLAHAKGALKALWLTPHIVRERRRIQRSRKIKPAEIDRLLYKYRPPKSPRL